VTDPVVESLIPDLLEWLRKAREPR